MSMRISVVGSGYVGTVVAACLAYVGHHVVGLESDDAKLAVLREGRAPFHEEDLDDLVAAGLTAGRLQFTDNAADAVASSQIIFLCVGTPQGADDRPDMSAMREAVSAIGPLIDSDHVIVAKSTVPIGSGRWLQNLLDEAGSSSVHQPTSCVVSNPEFLREGTAVRDFLHPDRVVIGGNDPRALDIVAAVYEPVLAHSSSQNGRRPPLIRTSLATAETIKYAANSFLAAKVSFINEIANICEFVGADVGEVAAAIGLDTRIGSSFLEAGVGWGGSCFGKDLRALIAVGTEHGYDSPLLRATLEVNEQQRRLLVKKVRRRLRGLRGQRVALLGLAFKPGTDDVRDAPAIDIARELLGADALVTAHDPVVRFLHELPTLRVTSDVFDAVSGADAVVLVTEWPEYRDLDLDRIAGVMRGNFVLDGRNALDAERVRAAGLVYDSIGRSRIREVVPAR